MRMRINGEARERLRQLLAHHARRVGLTPGVVDLLVQTAALERWGGGERIETADETGTRPALLVVGTVRVVCRTVGGRTVGTCFVPPGRLVPGTWPASERQALEPVVHDPLGAILALWSVRTIVEAFGTLPPCVAVHLVAAAGQAVLRLVEEKCELLGLGLRDRVLAVLGTLARDFGAPHSDGTRIELRLTHRDVAGAAMGSRANVTRALEDLRARGLVMVEQHRLVVTHRGLAVLDPGAERIPERHAV